MERKLARIGPDALAVFLVWLCACRPHAGEEVVCYAALDAEFSRPILEKFQEDSGIRVLMKFDTESTKSVGLAEAIISERGRPRCDVFWNNEIVNTIRLKKKGLLQAFRPKAGEDFPAEFKDPDGTWSGFAARARVLIVNTDLVKEAQFPRRTPDLANPAWKGKIGIAKPLFGTTATQVAVLRARDRRDPHDPAGLAAFLAMLKKQEVKIAGGNKGCARDVAAGALHMAFTDTDDAIIEKESGKPVAMILLDSGPEDAGALFIPNTLSLIRGCPNPENGKRLIEYLLSPAIEIALAKSASAQIPLNPKVDFTPRIPTPKTVKAMAADWDNAAELFKEAAGIVREDLLGE